MCEKRSMGKGILIMKKRTIQKVIVNRWIGLYEAFLTSDINFYEFQVAESELSEVSYDLLGVDNLKWLTLNYMHYHKGKIEDWNTLYSYLDDTPKETLFNKAIQQLGYEVN